MAHTGDFFGLRIKGDSMSPRISEGDVVIVRQQNDAESGDIVIVLVNGESATCKRLMKYKDGISLISFNPMYNPMTFSNDEIKSKQIKIIGKVVETDKNIEVYEMFCENSFSAKTINNRTSEHVDNYCVLDIETTGLFINTARIIEIAAIKVVNNKVVDEFSSLINPPMQNTRRRNCCKSY